MHGTTVKIIVFKAVHVTEQRPQLSHTLSLVCTWLRHLSFQLMADSV